jgi:NAD(P)-dependent dehydrogenase (short-subunit alcohol dehydrogenase family)
LRFIRETVSVEYVAIKYGLVHLIKYMTRYFEGMNVRVNALSPGEILDRQDENFIK